MRAISELSKSLIKTDHENLTVHDDDYFLKIPDTD